MQAVMGSGNVAGHAFLTCVSQTLTPGPIGRETSGKFFYSTRRRRRTSTFGPVWNCGRTSRQWCIQLMIAGGKARNAKKRLATRLASKWNRGYSQMVYYVRVWMAITVVCANSLLIRGSRDQQHSRHTLIPDGAALGNWQTWQDN